MLVKVFKFAFEHLAVIFGVLFFCQGLKQSAGLCECCEYVVAPGFLLDCLFETFGYCLSTWCDYLMYFVDGVDVAVLAVDGCSLYAILAYLNHFETVLFALPKSWLGREHNLQFVVLHRR